MRVIVVRERSANVMSPLPVDLAPRRCGPMARSASGHDAATVQFIAIFISSIYVVVNLLADVGTILITLLSSVLSVMQMPEAGRQIIYGSVIIVMLLAYARGRPAGA